MRIQAWTTKKTLTATVTVNEGYRFVSLMVNSTEIKSGESFTVTGPMTVTANFVEKKDLSLDREGTPDACL